VRLLEDSSSKARAGAHEFIKDNTDKLVLGCTPAADSALTLSVSKPEDENKKQQLFLGIHCRESSLDTELCAKG
jgi:hypothetical protein